MTIWSLSDGSWTVPRSLLCLLGAGLAIAGGATLQLRQDYRANSKWRREGPIDANCRDRHRLPGPVPRAKIRLAANSTLVGVADPSEAARSKASAEFKVAAYATTGNFSARSTR